MKPGLRLRSGRTQNEGEKNEFLFCNAGRALLFPLPPPAWCQPGQGSLHHVKRRLRNLPHLLCSGTGLFISIFPLKFPPSNSLLGLDELSGWGDRSSFVASVHYPEKLLQHPPSIPIPVPVPSQTRALSGLRSAFVNTRGSGRGGRGQGRVLIINIVIPEEDFQGASSKYHSSSSSLQQEGSA